MVIFTGTGRCGTRTASKVFDIQHEWRRSSEGALFGRLNEGLSKDGHPFPGIRDRVKIVEDHLSYFPGDAKCFTESSGAFFFCVDALHSIDPDVKVVHLIRDVRTYTRSTVSRGGHTRDDWTSRPHPSHGDAFLRWENWSPEERVAWIWAWRNMEIRRQAQNCEGLSYKLVHIEEFYDKIDSIAAFTELTPSPLDIQNRSVYNRSTRFAIPHYTQWDPDKLAKVAAIANDAMVTFSYGSMV